MMPETNGLLFCAQFAFAPNSLHYCGPEQQTNLAAYIKTSYRDPGLEIILTQFATLYPYLRLIAGANKIKNPFVFNVVEAYWLGNELLSRVKPREFANFATDVLALKRKQSPKELQQFLPKLETAFPHHAFHVLNIYKRTGHLPIAHTLETMDKCRIGWGKVQHVAESSSQQMIRIKTRPLIYEKDRLKLGQPLLRDVVNIGPKPVPGQWVAFHWDVVCSVLSVRQVRNLAWYTKHAINQANTYNP